MISKLKEYFAKKKIRKIALKGVDRQIALDILDGIKLYEQEHNCKGIPENKIHEYTNKVLQKRINNIRNENER